MQLQVEKVGGILLRPFFMNAPVVVFVRPQAAGNLGALARAMSNFGCRELRIAGEIPKTEPAKDARFDFMDWALAKRGQPVLSEAKLYPDLAAALDGIHFSLGTSGRAMPFENGYARPLVDARSGFESAGNFAKQIGSDFKWAIVLGPEDDGLWDEEASLCQKLIRLGTSTESPSLNVAMAAALTLYHWQLWDRGELAGSSKQINDTNPVTNLADTGPFLLVEPGKRGSKSEMGRDSWATVDQLEEFVDYVMETLSRTDFLKYPDTEAVKARVRRWTQVAPIPVGELLFAFELVYHVRAWGSGSFEGRNFLQRASKKK